MGLIEKGERVQNLYSYEIFINLDMDIYVQAFQYTDLKYLAPKRRCGIKVGKGEVLDSEIY